MPLAGTRFRCMESFDEDALQAAAAPGLEKAKQRFEAIAEEMAGQSADDIHAELVKRLESEPFSWDDKGLRDIASAISEAAPGANGAADRADDEEQPATSDGTAETKSEDGDG
jgi:hypothetical protein